MNIKSISLHGIIENFSAEKITPKLKVVLAGADCFAHHYSQGPAESMAH